MADIFNETENTLIAGTDDADSIENYGNNVTINAFGGNDTIVNNSINTTIRGGDGDDFIANSWWVNGMVYVYSGGNDTIDGSNDTNSYVIDGDWSFERTYDDYGTVPITVEGKGTLTLVNYWSEDVNIITSDEKIKPYNIITNAEDEIKVTGKSGKDYIDNFGIGVTVDARGGDDRIYNYADNVTIDGGAGDDYIYNGDATVSIDGGKGDDSIDNFAANVTIDGGNGDDYFSNEGENVLFRYSEGDGNDFISGFGENSTLDLNDAKFSLENDGEDVIVYVGDNQIILFGAANLETLNIIGEYDDDTNITDNLQDNTIVTGTDDADTIYNSGTNVTIDALGGDDFVGNYGANVSISGGSDSDKIDNHGDNAFLDGGGDDDYIYNGFLYGRGAAGDPGDNSTIFGGEGNDWIYNQGTNVSIDGGEGKDTISNYADNVTIWSGAGNDYIINGYGDGYSESDSRDSSDASSSGGFIGTNGNNVLFRYFEGDGNDSIVGFNETSTLAVDGSFSTKIKGENVIVTVGKNKINLVGAANLENPNIRNSGCVIHPPIVNILMLLDSDKSPFKIDDDVTIVDASARTKAIKIYGNDFDNTIIGGSGNDKLWGEGGDDTFVYFSGKDIIYDYENGETISLASAYSSASVKGDDVIFTFTGKNSLMVKDSAAKIITFADGTTYGGEISDSKTLTLTNADKSSVTLNSGVEIADASARTKSIKIYGNDSANTIIGGSGNDKLWGEGGDDLFVYTAGKDIINDYEDGDKISLASNYSSASIKGDDVIFNFSDGTLTVKDAASKIITFSDGSTFGGEISDSSTLTLTNADKSSVTLNSGVEIADASARTKAIKIYGNDLANTIIGGSGNDKFWGEGGSDTFIYSDGGGKDSVYDFGEDDLLEIVGEFSATYKKSSGDVVFKVGDGSITLKDSTATIFNVNGENYHISGTKLVK